MSRSKKSTSGPRPGEKKEAEDVFVEKTLEAANWAKQNSQALNKKTPHGHISFFTTIHKRSQYQAPRYAGGGS